MPYSAFWGRFAGQMNVTRIWFAGYINDGIAAGIYAEATEKLYERHYLVIKIVSSFFACLIKFLYL